MAAPTFVTEAETSAADAATKSTGNIAVEAGDLLVAVATRENATNAVTIASSPTETWTQRATAGTTTSHGFCRMWTASVSSTGNINVTFSFSGSDRWGPCNVLVFRNSDGVGAAANAANSGSAPSLNITTTQANSAIVVGVSDWNAIDGSSRTWRTGAGTLTEQTYVRDSSLGTAYIGYHADAGAIGTYATGLSSPTGQGPAHCALEVQGSTGGGAVSETSVPVLAGPLLLGALAADQFMGLISAPFNGEVLLSSTAQEQHLGNINTPLSSAPILMASEPPAQKVGENSVAPLSGPLLFSSAAPGQLYGLISTGGVAGPLLINGVVVIHPLLDQTPASGGLLLSAAAVGQLLSLNSTNAIDPLSLGGNIPSHLVGLNSTGAASSSLSLGGNVAAHLVGLNSAPVAVGGLLLGGDVAVHLVGLNNQAGVPPSPLILAGLVIVHGAAPSTALLLYPRKARLHRRPFDTHTIIDAAHPIAKGLLGLWIDGKTDYSIGGVHGSYVGDATATVVDGFRCTGLDNSGDWVSITADDRYNIGLGDFEFSAWVYPSGMASSTITSYGVFLKFADTDNNFSFRFRNSQRVQFYLESGAVERSFVDNSIDTELVNDEWQHLRVAHSRAGEWIRTWINNQQVSSISASLATVDITNSGPFVLGQAVTTGSDHSWKGYMRDVRWRKTLLHDALRKREYISPYEVLTRRGLLMVPYTSTATETSAPERGVLLLSGNVAAQLQGLDSAISVSSPLSLGGDVAAHLVGLDSAPVAASEPLILDAADIEHFEGLIQAPGSALALVLSGPPAVSSEITEQVPTFGAMVLTGATIGQVEIPYRTVWIVRDDQASAWTKRDDDDSSTEPT